jgi:hypothetical protein
MDTEVLRSSPLQRLPVPDSFSRLERWSNERWSNMRRLPGEQLLVREEELSQSSRLCKGPDRSAPREHELPTSPSRSPTGPIGTRDEEETTSEHRRSLEADFFGDELRGYRLLKAAKLSTSERQHILTLTTNSTRFIEVRRA